MNIAYGKYLEYIRKQPCLLCGERRVDADHLETIGMGGDRRKRTQKDLTCIPLCRKHHQERHAIGNEKVRQKYYIDVWREAFNLLRRYIQYEI